MNQFVRGSSGKFISGSIVLDGLICGCRGSVGLGVRGSIFQRVSGLLGQWQIDSLNQWINSSVSQLLSGFGG